MENPARTSGASRPTPTRPPRRRSATSCSATPSTSCAPTRAPRSISTAPTAAGWASATSPATTAPCNAPIPKLRYWLKSKLFEVSGLHASAIHDKILHECQSAGDFLRIVMEESARVQGVERWADCTPDHLLYMREIKREIPDALFVHIIRDGRDVALSYAKQGWAYPFPWDRNQQVGVAGLYWEWIVSKGRTIGKELGHDRTMVSF